MCGLIGEHMNPQKLQSVVIENVQLDTGEIVNLLANLGQGIDKEYFEILKHRSTRTLIRKRN